MPARCWAGSPTDRSPCSRPPATRAVTRRCTPWRSTLEETLGAAAIQPFGKKLSAVDRFRQYSCARTWHRDAEVREDSLAETSLEAATRSLGARTDPVFELFDYLKDVLFWIKDKKGIFRWVNTTLMVHMGKSSRDQIIGRTDFDLFEPYLANQYQMDDAQVLRGRAITSRVEMIVFHHTPRWIVTSKLPVRNASGRIVGTAGVATTAVQEGSNVWSESRLAPPQ